MVIQTSRTFLKLIIIGLLLAAILVQPIAAEPCSFCEFINLSKGDPGPQGVNGTPGGPGPAGTTSHNLLQNLTLDDHPQYPNVSGRAGGQTLTGGTTSGNLVLNGSANNGNVNIQPNGGITTIGTNVSFYRDTNAGADSSVALMISGYTGKFQGVDAGTLSQSWNFIQKNTAGNNIRYAAINAWETSGNANAETGLLRFYTKPTTGAVLERVRIDGAGQVLIGATTSPTNAMLDVIAGITFRNCSGTPIFGPSGQLICTSDEKAKKDIVPYTKVAKLPSTIQYNFNDASGYDTTQKWTGFSANEVQKTYPECVISRPDVRYDQKCTGNGDDQICDTISVPLGTFTLSIDQTCLLAASFNKINSLELKLNNICGQQPKLCEAQ